MAVEELFAEPLVNIGGIVALEAGDVPVIVFG